MKDAEGWTRILWIAAVLGCLVFLRLAPAQSSNVAAAPEPRALAAVSRDLPIESEPGPGVLELPLHLRWESFLSKDGLPSDEVYAIRMDGDRVWAGTRRGLAVFEGGTWRVPPEAAGLPHPVVLSLDVCPRTGDLWIGTMGGLARLSGGRLDTFTQLSSGLPNDFVHAIRCDAEEEAIWAATAMGAGRLDLAGGEWSIFTQANTPMHEPWTYAAAIGDGKVYIGAWGAGVLEYTKATKTWRAFRDPDKEFELDLFPDDGPVSDVTSSVDYAGKLLWQSSYTGLARYDGREWRSWFSEDSGLAGNFVNSVRAAGTHAWLATDQGLSLTDGDGWVTYRRLEDGRTEVILSEGGRRTERRVLPRGLVNNYVLGVDARGDEIWVATGGGVSHAIRSGPAGRRRQPEDPGADDGAGAVRADAGVPRERFRYASTPEELLPYRGRLPNRDLFTERSAYRGRGRELPEPQGLAEVRIGFIGPLTAEDEPVLSPGSRPAASAPSASAYGRRMLRGATLAVEEANAAGGHRGIPFRIVPRTDLVVWGQTSNELARFVFEDGVWAVLASVDSNHSHVLSRAALKAEVPVVSAGSTDPTLVEHSIPWLVRCIASDRQMAYSLLHEIVRVKQHSRIALLRVNNRDGRVGVGEFVDGARRLGRPIVLEQRFEPGERAFSSQIQRIREADADAVVLWGEPEETAAATAGLRRAGLTMSLYGFSRMAQDAFLEQAGAAAEGAVIAATMDPEREDPRWTGFRSRYRARWGEAPDAWAAHAFDGMNLILDAIRSAGLNRTRIRDELFALREVDAVTGRIVFDTNMSDAGPTYLAVVRENRFHFRQADPWEAPRTAPRRSGAAGDSP